MMGRKMKAENEGQCLALTLRRKKKACIYPRLFIAFSPAFSFSPVRSVSILIFRSLFILQGSTRVIISKIKTTLSRVRDLISRKCLRKVYRPRNLLVEHVRMSRERFSELADSEFRILLSKNIDSLSQNLLYPPGIEGFSHWLPSS